MTTRSHRALGVGADANDAEIKHAWRRLARRFHPDVSSEPDAEERFKAVNAAYERLRDPAARRALLAEFHENPGQFFEGIRIHDRPCGSNGIGPHPHIQRSVSKITEAAGGLLYLMRRNPEVEERP